VLGAIAFWFINRKKDQQTARKSWIKYITYFFIINILFLSIVFEPFVFRILGIMIVLVGLVEMIKLFWQAGFIKQRFWIISLLTYLVLSSGFLAFCKLDNGLVLFTFLVLSIFDAFSQISGQIAGKRKLFPSISPGKTVEGLIGGAFFAIGGSLLLQSLYEMTTVTTLLLSMGIVVFAFTGDFLASYFKRNFGVKDFSKLLPGHGGFLDRFDSLIAGGAFVALLELLTVI
jgi:phosphatidate cytidylyltransferase